MIRFRDVCFSDLSPPPPLPGPVLYSLCVFTCSLIFREGSWWFRERQKEQQRFAAEAQAPVRTPVESSIFIACTLPIHPLRSTRLADPGVSRSWDLQSPVPQPLQLSPWIMGSIDAFDLQPWITVFITAKYSPSLHSRFRPWNPLCSPHAKVLRCEFAHSFGYVSSFIVPRRWLTLLWAGPRVVGDFVLFLVFSLCLVHCYGYYFGLCFTILS